MVLIMIINSGVVFVTSDSLIQPMDIIHLRVPYSSLAHASDDETLGGLFDLSTEGSSNGNILCS